MASAPGGRARVGALLALMMALVPGCTSGGWGDGRAATVRLDQRGGDAFAWSERVSGSAVCAEVTLLVNGRPLPGGANVPVKDGRFSAVVPLGKGRNRIVARCAQGGGGAGESAPLEFTGRLKARPTAWIRVSVDGDTVTLDGGHSQPAEPDRARVVRYAWSPDPRHPASLTTPAGRRFGGEVDGPRLRLRAPDQDGEYHVRLTVTDAKGRADTSTAYFAVEGDKARAVDMAREHPRWIDSAVIYAPVPALWGDDGPAAVERHLGYLKRLGVDALWLWPPAEERAPGEEYAITDYFRLDPSWGPPAAFSSMVDKAHKPGMRVLLDIVPNHLSDQSPYFQDAGRYGRVSHYWGFFDRDAKGEPTHYFDWTNLPNLDYDNPEVRRMVVEAFSHWVRELGIDGFRVAATLQFTLPGMPALFAGDEIGASYQPYSDLTPIPWRDRHNLRPLYQRLIGLRHRVPALSGHHLELVSSTPDSSFAYLRPAPPGGEPVLVVLNFGGRAAVELRRTPRLDAALRGQGAMRDLLSDRPVRVEAGPKTVTVPMAAESAHVLTRGAG